VGKTKQLGRMGSPVLSALICLGEVQMSGTNFLQHVSIAERGVSQRLTKIQETFFSSFG
jgi:hypothetical protein